MAINYKNYLTANVTALTAVYTSPGTGYQSTLIGMIVCNVGTSSTTVTISITNSSTSTTAKILANSAIPPGTSLNVIDSNRLIIGPNDTLKVLSTAAVDVTVSAIEVSA